MNKGTSGGYMRAGKGWERSQFGVNMSCIALCEGLKWNFFEFSDKWLVIDHPNVKGRNHKEWCYISFFYTFFLFFFLN